MNWMIFTNWCIIGMVFTNNFLVWKRFYRLKTRVDEMHFDKWAKIFSEHPPESPSDLAYLKERGFIK